MTPETADIVPEPVPEPGPDSLPARYDLGMVTDWSPGRRFGPTRAAKLAEARYGLRCTARALPSEIDEVYLLATEGGERFILKIAHPGEDGQLLAAQNEAMAQLAAAGLAVPRARPDHDGSDLGIVADDDGQDRYVRLLTYLPGELLAEASARTPELFASLGRFLGALDRELQGFPAAALRRHSRWDLLRALDVRAHLGDIRDPLGRARVEAGLERFERRILPELRALRRGVIHNDANDYNVLVGGADEPRVLGLIDFGDLLHTAIVCELAIAMTYTMMLVQGDPVAAAAAVLGGYQREFPLEAREVALIPGLVEARTCVSVTIAASERTRHPENEYLFVSEDCAWQLLDWWRDGESELALALERACREADEVAG